MLFLLLLLLLLLLILLLIVLLLMMMLSRGLKHKRFVHLFGKASATILIIIVVVIVTAIALIASPNQAGEFHGENEREKQQKRTAEAGGTFSNMNILLERSKLIGVAAAVKKMDPAEDG